MTSDPADFRSDTVTRPTPAMRRAMAEAAVGDDVFGDDPTVIALEREAAALLGKEASLFFPSGTMANQAAVRVHCRPGDEVLLHEGAHVYRFEQGGLAALHGVQAVPLPGEGGRLAVEDLERHLRPDDQHFPRTRLVALENTHNLCGGAVLPPEALDAVGAFARRHGLAFHLDGARLVNAAVACGVAVARLAAAADSVSLCLSKGLGAPAGTVLAGSAPFVAAARRARKLLGGGMRQAGVLAAPARIALAEGPALLAEDHRRARLLAEGLAGMPHLGVAPPPTNIVVIEVPGQDVKRLLAGLAERGVLAVAFGPFRIRMVTHRDVGDHHVERAVAALAAVAGEGRGSER